MNWLVDISILAPSAAVAIVTWLVSPARRDVSIVDSCWPLFSPVMSVLLLRVSGVRLVEKGIGQRRPANAEYAARTNAIFPDPQRSPS